MVFGVQKGVFELQKYGFCFLNVALLQIVRHAFVECLQRVRFLYVTYSHYKSMVFDVQKYGFWGAKRGF